MKDRGFPVISNATVFGALKSSVPGNAHRILEWLKKDPDFSFTNGISNKPNSLDMHYVFEIAARFGRLEVFQEFQIESV